MQNDGSSNTVENTQHNLENIGYLQKANIGFPLKKTFIVQQYLTLLCNRLWATICIIVML